MPHGKGGRATEFKIGLDLFFEFIFEGSVGKLFQITYGGGLSEVDNAGCGQ